MSFDQSTEYTSFGGGASVTAPATIGVTANFVEVQFGGFATVSNAGTGTITGATWAGAAMTEWVRAVVTGADLSEDAIIFGKTGPTTGTQNAVISFSPSSAYGGHVVIKSWIGVDQTTPVGVTATNNSASQASPDTLSIVAPAGGIVSDFITTNTTSITVGGSQTQDANSAFGGGNTQGSSHLAAGTTMSWSWTGTARLGHCAIGMNVAGASSIAFIAENLGLHALQNMSPLGGI